MMLPLTIVDAFTDRPFAGNPAAVCELTEERDDAWMQAVAREMNLSETAFVRRVADGFSLRWFTPTVEVNLCGHATLATSHRLWEAGAPDETLRYHTRSGVLTATRREGWITLDFPARPVKPTTPAAGLLQALGLVPEQVRFTGAHDSDPLVELAAESLVRGLRPDFAALAALPVEGVIVTSLSSTPEFDFVSRFFAPGIGISEDPVTGAAHCSLAPHWSERFGRADLVGFQASARGGVVRVGARGKRVLLGGQAVTVLRGTLT